MLKYPGQFKDDYCFAKIIEVHPSEDGMVRQVTVEFKKKNTRESPSVYKSKPHTKEKVAVHRLHRLQLVCSCEYSWLHVDDDAQLDAVQARGETADQTVGQVSYVGAMYAQCEGEG